MSGVSTIQASNSQLQKFQDFSLVKSIKAKAIEALPRADGIYRTMEGLHLISKFPGDEKSNTIFLEKLRELYQDKYPDTDARYFNLVRHFRLLPQLCRHAAAIAPQEERDVWKRRGNEAIFLLVGTQCKGGSWGYYPELFLPEKVTQFVARLDAADDLRKAWESDRERALRTELRAKCSAMAEHYANCSPLADGKNGDSIVWTAYSLQTLVEIGLRPSCSVVELGVDFLLGAQDKHSGGWGYGRNQEPSLSATCIAISALLHAGAARKGRSRRCPKGPRIRFETSTLPEGHRSH
jgi:hypothetical protein